MLTKKFWNTLSAKTRDDIVYFITNRNSHPPYYQSFMKFNYEHDFDYDDSGKALKMILSHCRLQSDGTIDIVLSVKPSFGGITQSKEQADREMKKKAKDTSKKAPLISSCELSTYYVDYEDKNGDLCHVWVEATSKEDAKYQAKHEYWDIKEIISVKKE